MNKRLYLQVTYLATDLARSGWEFPDKIILPRWSMIIFLLISKLFFLLLQQLFFVESKQVLSRFGFTNYFQISIVVEVNKKKSATMWNRKTPARATTNCFKLIDKIMYVSIWRIIMTFLWFLSFFVVMRTDGRRRSSPKSLQADWKSGNTSNKSYQI